VEGGKTKNMNEEMALNRGWTQEKKFKAFENYTTYGARYAVVDIVGRK
jgi:hypothetical protein